MAKTILKLESPWAEVKEKIKENNLNITDDDLDYREGEEDRLLDRLAGIMQKSKEEVKIYIESLSANKDMAG
jgi:uncharacterized protein YjbJ (UPF0337 family)